MCGNGSGRMSSTSRMTRKTKKEAAHSNDLVFLATDAIHAFRISLARKVLGGFYGW